MLRVMFVCLGNICRSAMAECIMTDLVKQKGLDGEFVIASAGTSDEEEGNLVYPPAARKLREMGVEVLSHSAKQLKASDYGDYDLFLCAEQKNVTAAKRIMGGDSDGKIILMLDLSGNPRNIADPWWTGDFTKAYEDISEACECLLRYAMENGFIKAE
ncbi:MAG: low molecular weight phosphotyrosine protein phosphatase [Clostridia bacterium]|jgi:protein-tyrosine phosphatase|nr:low molecular weight phosphotyrosine protein phosphatase [Clostridia bacterium]